MGNLLLIWACSFVVVMSFAIKIAGFPEFKFMDIFSLIGIFIFSPFALAFLVLACLGVLLAKIFVPLDSFYDIVNENKEGDTKG